MTLINVDASLPVPMWAVVRLLVHENRPMTLDRTRKLLSPSSLTGGDHKMFDQAISTLLGLGFIQKSEEERISLAGRAATLDGTHWEDFCTVLRKAVFEPELNQVIMKGDKTTGAADLNRALCWFLSLDPTAVTVGANNFEAMQDGALIAEARPAIPNPTRWNRFTSWATTIGLAAPALPTMGDPNHYVPDCTVAIRQTVMEIWEHKANVNAVEFVRSLRDQLPVLPGGAYSRSLGVEDPGDTTAGPALSFALLRGGYEEWLEFGREADAKQLLSIYDRERPATPHTFSSVTVFKDYNG
ncbi:protein DpdG [Sphaerisporangium krabiense]|nr:protein DpdG [Sphaerisporangium krabiense]